MKRLLLIPLLASIAASPAAAPAQSRPAAGAAQGLRARPVEIAVHAPRPKDLPDDLAFYGPEDGRYEIGYLVRGTGFSRVDKDSFRVSSATAGGTDISKNAKGAPSWSLDPFPKVSDDGTAATFTLRVDPGRDRMKAAMPVVHGSIDLRLEGELGALASLVLVADGEELEPGMKMTFDARSATWSFPAAGGSSVKVKAEIWKDIRRETVSF